MTLLLAFFFVILALVALFPPFLVMLGGYSGSFVERYESFLGENGGTFVSIGTVFLVSGLAVWAAAITNSATDRREVYGRKMQAALQKSQFRQRWIDDLRDALAVFIADISNETTDYETSGRNLNQILLRLPMHEDEAKEVAKALQQLMNAMRDPEQNESMKAKARTHAVYSAQKFLKREWGTLKKELDSAEGIEFK
ncbi:hypothetical protein SAMN06265173_11270 [Thalassovita litoralis]|jgi:hypothetical protein|uniref:Uncharacterized protein n=1 Tax=Thalassovita litoralis TaxID=1010611 RepID=A0A521DSL3_9RHOB|nr:hypothetical protein [Thalassovita litoralis]SMO74608.1 hypothetical protein SAMN06265173_11270 [Thalassovita litoralis]